MGTRRSAVYERALVLLKDGDWHDYDEIVRKCAILVPPGIAVRATENERLRWTRRRGGDAPEGPASRVKVIEKSREIEIGARIVVTRTLKDARRFEIDPRGKVSSRVKNKRIRLTKPD